MPSAWLFCGPNHVGKFQTALLFAQAVNCHSTPGNACGHCDSCRQIEHQSHADVLLVEPQDSDIRIDQIRQVGQWVQFHPGIGKKRIVIIKSAEKLNKESSNAFLKTLEDPPLSTLIILLAESTGQLLETIVSRCAMVRFYYLNPIHVDQILREKFQLSENDRQFLQSLAMGQIQEDWINRLDSIRKLHQRIATIMSQSISPQMETLLKHCQEWQSTKHNEWGFLLSLLEFWFRDLRWIQCGLNPEKLFYPTYHRELEQAAVLYTESRITEAFELVIQTRIDIQNNANKLLALEHLWLSLKKVLG
ncbi:MAG: DNA polymerase III subunit delta' [SAR324 cluster bacterium]|nr:DNA polymerase III subunit delta' [SAR324 cluster bacterium]